MKSKLLCVLAVGFLFACVNSGEGTSIDCSECSKSITGYDIVVATSDYDATVRKQLRAFCPEGKKVLSAGWSALDDTDAILSGRVLYSEPSFDGSHWMVNVENTDLGFSPSWKLRMRCICADVE